MTKNMIHIKAPGNWINDPNGFIYYQGKYHIFYQCFPYEPRWGRIHWGHAVSEDLICWEHRGIALFPTKPGDRDGCFSGSGVEYNGNMYLFYTGVKYLEEDPEDTNRCLGDQFVSAQMMITSEDGFHFDNVRDKRMIIPPFEDPEVAHKAHTRDPKVWRGENGWNMVLGTGGPEGSGKLLFYKSNDLHHWSYVNSVSKAGFGWMWECPDYFEVKGGKVLTLSPIGFLKDGYEEESQAICMMVDFDEASCTMKIPDHYQYMDYGLDLYAAQSTVDEEGRRIMVAWARMPEAVDGEWNGMFCMPRVAEAEDGHIFFRPHPNVKKAYCRQIETPFESGEAGYRLSIELEEGEEINIGGYRIFRREGKICTDRSMVSGKSEGRRMVFSTPELKKGYHLDVYVDPNLIEVFVNNGEFVITNTVYGLGSGICTGRKEELLLYTVE